MFDFNDITSRNNQAVILKDSMPENRSPWCPSAGVVKEGKRPEVQSANFPENARKERERTPARLRATHLSRPQHPRWRCRVHRSTLSHCARGCTRRAQSDRSDNLRRFRFTSALGWGTEMGPPPMPNVLSEISGILCSWATCTPTQLNHNCKIINLVIYKPSRSR